MGGVSDNVLSPIGALGAMQFLQCGKSTANDFFFSCIDPLEGGGGAAFGLLWNQTQIRYVNMLSIEQW